MNNHNSCSSKLVDPLKAASKADSSGSFAEIGKAFNLTVVISALGYFVDLFDIAIFGVVRVESLKALGYTDPNDIFSLGLMIYNWGMVGMILGGLLWGVLADKFGRISVLFGSILLYSLGTLANAFVWDAQSYAVCRFITSIGLAGELGAAITLVSESLPPHLRGIGTTIVAGVGLSGSVAAVIVSKFFDWKTTYIIGGSLGFLLLATRIKMMESSLFMAQTHSQLRIERGNLLMLLKPERFMRYLRCVLIGTPIYFITGVLFTFSPEIGKELGIAEGIEAGHAILFGTIGLSLGDFLSGILSHVLKSRRQAIAICLKISLVAMIIYLTVDGLSPTMIYLLCFILGLTAGYWAVLITVAAEQFGTNLRGSVATTVPNMVRGSAVLATLGFSALKEQMPLTQAALVIGVTCFTLALSALLQMEETFGRDLNFLEISDSDSKT